MPFDPDDVIDNLRLERYANHNGEGALDAMGTVLKDDLLRLSTINACRLRKHLQRAQLNGWRDLSFPRWPVDTTVEDLCEQLFLLSMRAQALIRFHLSGSGQMGLKAVPQ